MSGAHPRDQPLQGKAAVVTGAGRGIGRAIAVGYAAAGASVCCAARIREQIEETAARIRENGGRGIAVAAEVTDREAVEKMFRRRRGPGRRRHPGRQCRRQPGVTASAPPSLI